MPFYEYECRSCGVQTEVLQKISDKPLRKCEACGKSALVKLVSAPIFRLKGGGWYETDFKSDGEAKRNLAGEKEPGESKAEAATDSKAADKAADKPAEKAADAAATKAETKPAATAKPATKSPAKSPAKKPAAKPTRKPAPRKAASRRR